MRTEDTNERDLNESLTSAKKVAEKTDRVLVDTAQRYLKRRGVDFDVRQLEKTIREKPVTAAALAATVGFIVGGGLATRPGTAMLVLLGRMAARETAVDLVTGMVRT
jgi:ElaB/YqjD/DUF883 family membrane-anchored ribosome-binding protein